MGNITSVFNRLRRRKEEIRILMVGLDAAGKTSILLKLKHGRIVTTIPTIGLNVETVEYQNIKFTVLDVGGHDKVRPLWRHYFKGTQGLIFVVDSDDRERLSEAKYELQKMLKEDDLKDAKVLIFANKQDERNALDVEALAERLCLPQIREHTWHIQPSRAITGEGLYDGLDWLASQLVRW